MIKEAVYDVDNAQNGDCLEEGGKMASFHHASDESCPQNCKQCVLVLVSVNGNVIETDAEGVGAIEVSKNCNQINNASDESKEECMNLVLASANGAAAAAEADAERVSAIEESKNYNQSADVVPDLVVLWLGQPCARLVCVIFFLVSSFIFLTVRPSGLGVWMAFLMAINYCLYVVRDMAMELIVQDDRNVIT
jgi:hypothetical protein